MHDTSILDLGLLPQYAAQAPRSVVTRARIWLAALAFALLAGAAFAIGPGPAKSALEHLGLIDAQSDALVRLSLDDVRKVDAMTVDDKSQIMAEGLDAQEKNTAIPVIGLPLEKVRQFLFSNIAAPTQMTALRCLTQAVYYEAAVEPLEGRRAVAQVVLNRMRHPSYPNSVCGVVYQGSQRRTGCQFSFTCDGSLLRAPAAGPWRAAEAIAAAALGGYVEPSVGTATHYHADYVLPKWAFQLGKIGQIGRHIFYRFNGSWGRSAAFTSRYSGMEAIPSMNMLALSERLAADGTALPLGAEAFTPGLTVAPHITDRHATSDVGGRLDTTKEWRLTIPDPVAASTQYRKAVSDTSVTTEPASEVAMATPSTAAASQ